MDNINSAEKKRKTLEYEAEADKKKVEKVLADMWKAFEESKQSMEKAGLLYHEKQALELATRLQQEINELVWQNQVLHARIQERNALIQKNDFYILEDKSKLEKSWAELLKNGYADNLFKSYQGNLTRGEFGELVHNVWCNTNINEKDRTAAIAKSTGISEEQIKKVENETPGVKNEIQARQSTVEDFQTRDKQNQELKAKNAVDAEQVKKNEVKIVEKKEELKTVLPVAVQQDKEHRDQTELASVIKKEALTRELHEIQERLTGKDNNPEKLKVMQERMAKLSQELPQTTKNMIAAIRDKDKYNTLKQQVTEKTAELKGLKSSSEELKSQNKEDEKRAKEIEEKLKSFDAPASEEKDEDDKPTNKMH